MSEVENRLMKLSLDNGNFEKNAQTSINTLEKLKTAMDFGGATKSFDEIERSAKEINFSALSNAIDTINSRFSAMGEVGANILRRLTDAAIDSGKKLINVLQKPLDQVMTGGWKRASDIAQAKFQIEGLNKDWEALKQNINDAVDQTSYGFNEAALVASQFSATGLEAGQKMYEYLRGVAGVAAMTNSTYSDIGHIFTTISGQGKLMTEQLNQFAGRGLNVAAELGKQLHKTEAEIREMTTDGEISFATFAQAMYDAYGTQAAKANETFTGSLANMKAALSRIGQPFAESIQKYMVPVFNKLREFINNIKKSIENAKIYEYFDGIMKGVTKLVEHIIDKIDLSFLDEILSRAEDIYKVIEKVLSKATEAVDWVADKFSGITKKVKKDSGDLVATVEVTAEKIEELAKAVIHGDYGNGEERRNKLADMYEKVQNKVNELMGNSFRYGEVATEANEEVADSLEKVYTNAGLTEEEINELAKAVIRGDYGNGEERVEKLGDKYGIVQNKVNELLGCSYRYKIVQDEVTESIEGTIKAADVIQGKLTFYTKGLSSVITSCKTFVKEFKNAFADEDKEKNLGKLNDIISGLSAGIDILGGILGSVIGGVAKPFAEITRVIADGLLDAGSAIGIWIQKLNVWMQNTGAYEKIANTVSWLGDRLVAIVKYADKFFRLSFSVLFTLFGRLGNIIGQLTERVKEFYKAFIETPAFKRLKEDFERFTSAVQKAKDTILDGITKWLDKFSKKEIKLPKFDAESFAKSVSDKITWLLDRIHKLRQGFTDFFETKSINPGSIFKSISDFFKDFSVSGTIDKFVDLLKRAKEAIFGFFEGKEFKVNKLQKTSAKDAVDTISGFFKTMKTSAGDLMSGKIGSVSEFIDTIKEKIVSFVGMLKKHWPEYEAIWNNIIDILKGGTVINVLLKVNSIMSSLAGIAKGFKDVTGDIGGVFQSITKIFDNFGGIFSSISEGISTFAAGYKDLLSARAKNERSSAFLKNLIAISIGLVAFAGSMKLLSTIPEDSFQRVNAQIVLITACLGALIATYNLTKSDRAFTDPKMSIGAAINNIFKGLGASIKNAIKNVGKSSLLIAFAALIASIGVTIKILSTVPFADGIKALGYMGTVLLMMVGVLKTISKITNGKDLLGAGVFLIAFGHTAKTLASTVKKLAKMSFKEALKGMALMGLLFGEMLAVLLVATKLTKNSDLKGFGGFLILFAITVKLLTGSLKKLTKIPFADGIKALTFMGILFAEMLGVLAVGSKVANNKKMAGMGVFLVLFSVAVRLLVSSVKALSRLKRQDINKAIGALNRIFIMIDIMLLASKKGEKSKSSFGELIGIIGLVMSVTSSLVVLATVPYRQLEKSIDALTRVFRSLSVFVFFLGSGLFGKKGDAVNELIEVIGIVGILHEVVWAFKQLETVDAAQMDATEDSVSKVLDSISRLIRAANIGMSDISVHLGKKISFDKKAADKWYIVLLNYAGAGGLLFETAYILKWLDEAKVDPDAMTKRSEALARVATALGILMAGLGQLGGKGDSADSIKSLLASGLIPLVKGGELLAFIVALAGIASAIHNLAPDVETFIDEGLTSIGQAIGSFLGGILSGALKPVLEALPEYASNLQSFIGQLTNLIRTINTTETEGGLDLTKITDLKDTMDALMEISWDEFRIGALEALNRFFVDGEGKTPLDRHIDSLKSFIGQIGELQETFTQKFGDTDPTSKIETLSSIMSALAEVGFTKFLANIGALAGSAMDTEQVYDATTDTYETVVKETTTLDQLMTTLTDFITEYAKFYPELDKLPEDPNYSTTKLDQLKTTLRILGQIGWTNFTSGIKAAFGTSTTPIKTMMSNLTTFITEFSTFEKGALTQLSELPDAETKLENLKTVLDKLGEIGWSNLKDTLIEGLVDFFDMSGDTTVFDPNSGTYITTHQESAFQSQLTRLSEFVDAFKKFEDEHLKNISTDATSIVRMYHLKAILDVLNEITPASGGFLQLIFGENNIAQYGQNLVDFGKKFVEFKDTVEGVDFSKALSVTDDLVQFAEKFDALVNENNGLFNTGTAAFSIESFGMVVAQWFTNIATAIDNNSSILTDAGGAIFSYIVQGFKDAADAIGQVITPENWQSIELPEGVLDNIPVVEDVKGTNHFIAYIINALTGKTSMEELEKAAKTVTDAIKEFLSKYIKSNETDEKTDSVKAAILTVIKDIKDKGVEIAADFKEVGKAMMMGIKAGIEEGKAEAINAAAAAGSESVQATRDAVGMNSPAKKFIEIAMYSMKGLAVGFTKYAPVATDAVGRVAGMAVKSMNDGLSEVSTSAEESSYNLFESLQGIYGYINDLINGTIDTQPKITPVMDLSNIQNGTNLLGKMLSGTNGYSLNLGGMNLSAVVDSLNTKSSENQMIVDAIYELRSDVNNLSDAMSNMGVTLEDGTLVGKLAPKMSARMRLLASGSR